MRKMYNNASCGMTLLLLLLSVATLAAEVCVIDIHRAFQKISGFGASSTWTSPISVLADRADLFYSTTHGIGLSLLRNRIPADTNPSAWARELPQMKAALAHGVKIWSAEWSPPASWKSNGSLVDGGTLEPDHYKDYANKLADYTENLKENGIDLIAVSPFNEPEYAPGYESCIMTGEEIRDFLQVAGPVFEERGLTTRFIIPETFTIRSIPGYANWALGDPLAVKYVYAVATHLYQYDSTTVTPYEYASVQGLEVWVTEMCDAGSALQTPFDSSMVSGLRVAGWIHYSLAQGNMSAFHYWWLAHDVTNNGLMSVSFEKPPKRFWTMGNFSRFVRPGFRRIECTADPEDGIHASAYRSSGGDTCVIVAINYSDSAIEQRFELAGVPCTTFTPWVTSPEEDLAAHEKITVVDSSLTYTLPAQSVISFVAMEPGNVVIGASDRRSGRAHPLTDYSGSVMRVYNVRGQLLFTTDDVRKACSFLDRKRGCFILHNIGSGSVSRYVRLTSEFDRIGYYCRSRGVFRACDKNGCNYAQ